MNVRPIAFLSFVALSISIAGTLQAQFRFEGQTRYEPEEVFLFGCSFSSDGSFLAVGGDSIRIFHAVSGDLIQQSRPILRPRGEQTGMIPVQHLVQLISKNEWTRRIVFSPVFKDVFASAGDDGVVRIWKVSQSQPLQVLPGHKGRINQLVFSPNGRLLMSGDSRSKRSNSIDEIRVWDVVTGELVRSEHFYNDGVSCVTFLDDETVVFARNDDKENRDSVIEFFDARSWTRIRSVPFTPGGAFSVVLSPSQDKMVIAGGQCVPLGPNACRPTGYLWISDLSQDVPAKLVPTKDHGYFSSALPIASRDRFVTDTTMIRKASVVDCLEMRSLLDGEVLWARECGSGSLHGVAVSPDGRQVVYCGNKKVIFLDAETGERLRSIEVAN